MTDPAGAAARARGGLGRRLAAALGLLAVGAVTAVATVAVHSRPWGLPLAAVATLAVLLATRPGPATRLPLAVGWLVVLGAAVAGRPEGDFVLAQAASGYAVLGLGLVVLVVALATLGGGRGPRVRAAGARRPSMRG